MTVEVNKLAPARSGYLYPAFIASLALNLLFVGLFAAAAWHHHEKSLAANEPGLLGFVRQLPENRQDAVRNEITGARAAMKDLRASVRKSWNDANALLTQEPFDKVKFAEALAKLRETETVYKSGLNSALVETAASLSPEERKILQSWRETRRPNVLRSQGESAKEDGAK
ncbi:periplasmic heavy metal sensor [Hyphomicrobium sp. 99]|uniref:periplasmic heavy metal sensor n=1 Tax=Hyphomicrobium sp. 99 TaxID=1163419 RepID=UPI0005F7BBD9|nr:periplasmic heavy metal sensor [Hyphomicrobium sp. 99]